MSSELNNHEISFLRNNEITKVEKKTVLDVNLTKEFQNVEHHAKEIATEYCEKMASIITVGPMEKIYAGQWNRIKLEKDIKDIEVNLKECNPNYSLGKEWRTNCQRCVPTYEMRRRGYDVTALPKPSDPEKVDLSYSPFSVWENPEVIKCSKNGIEDIERKMHEWGDGTRAQVVVVWKNTNAGHTFIAEQVNGQTIYIDPQSGKKNVKNYFSYVESGSVRISRIDNLDVTGKILNCCRRV